MALLKKVESILTEAFPPPDKVKLGENDGIIGAVVSSRFEEVDTIDRINMIWDILDERLSKSERRQVLTVVAITPVEEIAHRL